MKRGVLGLKEKFLVALSIAAALPFLVGLIIFEIGGFRHLLAERGKLHQLEALTLARALDQQSIAEGGQLRTWLAAEPSLIRFVVSKNRDSAGRAPDEIAAETRHLDELWALLLPDDPQLLALLNNQGSVSLAQYRALHPDTAEILATDARGRLVAATGKTTDVEQADEAWWQKGASLPKGGQWTDVLRFDASSGVFSLDIIVPLHDGDAFAGVAKMSVDVTSLFPQLRLDGGKTGELWQIVLPDGRILASSESGSMPLMDRLPDETLAKLRSKPAGWAVALDRAGRQRMTGFTALGEDPRNPIAHVIFSSMRDDVVESLRRDFAWLGVGGASLLALCVFVGFHRIRLDILQPLSALGHAARSISAIAQLRDAPPRDEVKVRKQHAQAEMDLQTIRAIRTGDEIEALAGDIAVMTSRVLRYQRELESEVAEKTAVIRADLEMAREFQNALLPSHYPEVPPAAARNPLRLKFAHFYQPASTVGGDFFDLIELDENRAGILIADVMGHGARSALVTAILRALVRNHAGRVNDPGAFLGELNQHLIEVISRSGQTLFVTAFFLILDTRNAKASWAVAGHPAPLRTHRGNGRMPEPLWTDPPRQPALGLIADTVFRTAESPLKPGDVFLLFTDGAVEAENPAGEIYGGARLAASFDEALDGPMAAMPAKIVCDVTAFQKRQNYDDDVCLVAVEAVNAPGQPAPSMMQNAASTGS
jgi:serine phosphatase RsbU (regulator of sigma subunit)